MVNKGIILVSGGVALLIGALAFSPKAQDTLAGTGLGSALGVLRESAGGETTTTITEETIGGGEAFSFTADAPVDIPTVKTSSSSSSSNQNQSVKGGVALRNSSGVLTGVEDSTADSGRGQSRLPTPVEKIFNRPIIKETPKPLPSVLKPVKNWWSK